MKCVMIGAALAASALATGASAQLKISDLPPSMRPAAPAKLVSPARVLPSAPMTASSTLARVSPELSVSAPRRTLAVVPDLQVFTRPRVAPTVNVVVPASPDPVETRKAATMVPIETPRIVQVRRTPVETANRPCPTTASGAKKSCK